MPRAALDDDARGWADPTVLGLLREIRDELRALRTDPPRRGVVALTRADRARLARVLPAVAGAIGSDEFTVAELLDYPATRVAIQGFTPAQMGRLLHRATGEPVDGYVVERGGTELHRRLWRVVATV